MWDIYLLHIRVRAALGSVFFFIRGRVRIGIVNASSPPHFWKSPSCVLVYIIYDIIIIFKNGRLFVCESEHATMMCLRCGGGGICSFSPYFVHLLYARFMTTKSKFICANSNRQGVCRNVVYSMVVCLLHTQCCIMPNPFLLSGCGEITWWVFNWSNTEDNVCAYTFLCGCLFLCASIYPPLCLY